MTMLLQNQVQKKISSFYLTNFQIQELHSGLLFGFFFFSIVWLNLSKILTVFTPWVKLLVLLPWRRTGSAGQLSSPVQVQGHYK